jgi:hypothetical protein
MRTVLQFILALLLVSGCADTDDMDGYHGRCGHHRTDASPPPDLATPPPKCPAAKGLSGDNLLCADFAKATSLTDSALSGWDFVTNCGTNSWEIAAGKLQIKNFGTFVGSCAFTMPALNFNDADKQKYNSITLSVIHRIDLNDPEQEAAIWFGGDYLASSIL